MAEIRREFPASSRDWTISKKKKCVIKKKKKKPRKEKKEEEKKKTRKPRGASKVTHKPHLTSPGIEQEIG